MTRDERLHQVLMQDVVDMQAIREATAETGDAAAAARQVLGEGYTLTAEVAAGIEEHEGRKPAKC